jgi:hypothetical protein
MAEQEVENLSGLSTNPEKDIFVVRENGTTCLMAEFAAKFIVPYDAWASNYVDVRKLLPSPPACSSGSRVGRTPSFKALRRLGRLPFPPPSPPNTPAGCSRMLHGVRLVTPCARSACFESKSCSLHPYWRGLHVEKLTACSWMWERARKQAPKPAI